MHYYNKVIRPFAYRNILVIPRISSHKVAGKSACMNFILGKPIMDYLKMLEFMQVGRTAFSEYYFGRLFSFSYSSHSF